MLQMRDEDFVAVPQKVEPLLEDAVLAISTTDFVKKKRRKVKIPEETKETPPGPARCAPCQPPRGRGG